MARSNNSGVIRPYKKTTHHTLKNGKTRTYTSYEARIDMGEDENGKRSRKTVSAKTYKQCMSKINAILKDKNDWGMAVSKTVKLGPYAEDRRRQSDTQTRSQSLTLAQWETDHTDRSRSRGMRLHRGEPSADRHFGKYAS